MAAIGKDYSQPKAIRIWLAAREKKFRESPIVTETVKVEEPQETP